MKTVNFLKHIIAAILCSAVVFYICTWIIPVQPYMDVLIYAILFFTVLTSSVYWLGVRSLIKQQNNFFLYIIILNVFVKLVASFVFMFLYVQANDPTDRYFLVPFLLTYLIFTIFETYILSIQARSSK